MDARLASSVASARLILEQLVAPTGSRRFLVDPGCTVRVGRRADLVGIVVLDPRMSSLHFSIAWDGTSAVIQDLESRSGTMLNGSRMGRSAPLKHGDWIRAGASDFHVYEEGFTQRGPRASTPQKDAIYRLLREHEKELYAVVDVAKNLRIAALLKESADERCDLYEGHERDLEGERGVAPYLVKLSDAASPLLGSLVREGWGESWGIYMVSARPFKDLWRHFQGFLRVDDPVGQDMIFRFYEPRGLQQLLRQFVSRWVEEVLFEGVACFIVESEGGHGAHILRAQPGQGLSAEDVKL